ncbi:MAG TPA: hypothetical protein GXX76_06295 [Bacteroidales bacterium]|nr:hypothetical protein [Bacteroidales bacterium]
MTVVNKTYINSSGIKVLEYIPPVSIMLDLPHILTLGKILSINMPYLKLEKKIVGHDIVAIRLIDFEDENGIVTLYVQELKSKKTYYLSANMDYDGDMWMWSLADYKTLTCSTN